MQETVIEIHWTSANLEEARKISHLLVQKHLVACAQLIPMIESIFIWNHQLETAQESKVVFKTRLGNYEKIKEIIEQNCQYEVPEITWVRIEGGNSSYMDWVLESTKNLVCSER